MILASFKDKLGRFFWLVCDSNIGQSMKASDGQFGYFGAGGRGEVSQIIRPGLYVNYKFSRQFLIQIVLPPETEANSAN